MSPSEIIGKSAGGRAIEMRRLTDGPTALLLIGGVHGDEKEGFTLVERFIKEGAWASLQGLAALWVIPRMNPDGCEKNERLNDHGVDLNRNLPTRDWDPVAHKPRYNPGPGAGSEPENQALISVIERLKPRALISAHSWNPMINYNGPSLGMAKAMSALNGYVLTSDIGYPTPGSLGTWAGLERQIPTITLEIERGLALDRVWEVHHQSTLAGLTYAAKHENLS